jgi:arylsulfatase A-like enzyme
MSDNSFTWKRKYFGVKRMMAGITMLAMICFSHSVRGESQPNIVLILADDLGFSDVGCYGGDANTPNINMLATNGLIYTQFYNSAKCCPTRASLLTGLYPHQADIGHMEFDDRIPGYRGDLNPNTVTIAEALRSGGYATFMSGKWHVTRFVDDHKHNWPVQRGFDDFYGIIAGAANYYQPNTLTRNNERIEPQGKDFYLTDRITDEAVRQIREHVNINPDKPFFQYVAYTAPHWPLHALEEDILKYKGMFDDGWDAARERRWKRMADSGIIRKKWQLTGRDPRVKPWMDEENKEWQARRMEVFTAQIDRLDQGIGRILSILKESGVWDNTLIIFMSDNGGCTEELRDDYIGRRVRTGFSILGTPKTRDGREVRYGNEPGNWPGPEESYVSYGVPWANVSNAPFRLYKRWVHEGGISAPFIVHWPAGIRAKGEMRRQPAQLPDVMATLLDIAGVNYPSTYEGRGIKPLEGYSMQPTFENKAFGREVLYWEHEGNRAVRKGRWKLVSMFPGDWELYDMEADRTELNDLSRKRPEIVKELKTLYEVWAARCKVKPWDEILEGRKAIFEQRKKERENNKESEKK